MTSPSRWPDPWHDASPGRQRSDVDEVPTATAELHDHPAGDRSGDESAHGGHRLMMLVCCIPMIAIVALLVATGGAGWGAILWALGCVAMMTVMMLAMPGGHGHK